MKARPGAPLSARPRCVLVAVQLPGVSDADHAADIAELGRLAGTLGFEVVATVSQRRDALAAAAVIGEGKLKELADITGGKGVVPSGAPPVKTKARAAAAARRSAAAGPTERSGAAGGGGLRAGDQAGMTEGHASSDAGGAEGSEVPPTVIVDHEITPSQARNLERATGARVIDRTGVIVDIFHRHARSREARIQVEIARLSYVAPRMRESSSGKERQRGRGAGEAAIELDRRKIRDRVAELREQLVAIQADQDHRRLARRDQLRVALVGYTNAGKSSLMRALTGSQVLVEDKLFATLDTTVRALQPETAPRILVSDTVGFIKKLPHDLVASFRSTLDEALEASLLLHVVDAADPGCEAQLDVTRDVLRDIGAGLVPTMLIFNKADRLDPDARRKLIEQYRPRDLVGVRTEILAPMILSAHDPEDVAALRAAIVAFFERSMVEETLVVPYAMQPRLGEVYENARVVAEEYDERGARLTVRALPPAIERLKRAFS